MGLTLYTRNIFETGDVTVTGTPDEGFPASRLYDRSISLYWKETVTESKNFVVDQGAANNLAIDFLAVEKHNFNGILTCWQWSTDDFGATSENAVPAWTQGDNLQIIKTLDTALTKRYWRVRIAALANPMCGEIFMSLGRNFKVSGEPAPEIEEQDNVRWNKTIGGLERSTKFGAERRKRKYVLILNPTELVEFRAAMAETDSYSKPFYIKDTEGDYWLCRLLSVPTENPSSLNNLILVDFDIIEIL